MSTLSPYGANNKPTCGSITLLWGTSEILDLLTEQGLQAGAWVTLKQPRWKVCIQHSSTAVYMESPCLFGFYCVRNCHDTKRLGKEKV